AFDMFRFTTKWQPQDSIKFVYPKTSITDFFPKIAGYDRVFGNFSAENAVYFHLPSVEGYDPLYIKRYGEFIAGIDTTGQSGLTQAVVLLPRESENTSKAINLLGIKYFLQKKKDNHKNWTFPIWNYPKDQFKLIFSDSQYEVFENTYAFPRAFLVGSYKVIQNQNGIISAMFAKGTDLRDSIILEKDPHVPAGFLPSGTVKIASYTPDKITINVSTNVPQLLFLSDAYYPGWKAYVDGKVTEIYRADYAFRAVKVPAGKHMIIFSYQPQSFFLGLLLAAFGVIGMLGALWYHKEKA
ncbi:MAG TPA: YfhO family protein, partial [Candidatus Saccharimonadales bacterium]|nr:YfhO family protein [Candidatus Saccharimonadales bacterium]